MESVKRETLRRIKNALPRIGKAFFILLGVSYKKDLSVCGNAANGKRFFDHRCGKALCHRSEKGETVAVKKGNTVGIPQGTVMS